MVVAATSRHQRRYSANDRRFRRVIEEMGAEEGGAPEMGTATVGRTRTVVAMITL
jgi:hypothetical protein